MVSFCTSFCERALNPAVPMLPDLLSDPPSLTLTCQPHKAEKSFGLCAKDHMICQTLAVVLQSRTSQSSSTNSMHSRLSLNHGHGRLSS